MTFLNTKLCNSWAIEIYDLMKDVVWLTPTQYSDKSLQEGPSMTQRQEPSSLDGQ